MTQPHLSIIIPTYNEAKRIVITLQKIHKFLESQDYGAEVLVVDDGSTDNTVVEIEKFLPDFPQLRLIKNQQNKGKGEVVKQGMLEAIGEWRLFTDADNATPITEIYKLLPYTPDYKVIIGSRYVKGGTIHIKQPLKRQIISRAGNVAIQIVLGLRFADTQCGFKLFSAEATKAIFTKQTMKGWSFDIELLTIARVLGYPVKEVGVDWFDSPDSALRASRAAIKSFNDLLKIRRNQKGGQYS